jgi:alpha-glucuronidase
MKKILPVLTPVFFLVAIQAMQAQSFTLVKRGTPKSVIILAEKPTVAEIQAAKVLQDYIERISGARLSIEDDSVRHKDLEILIGNVNRPELNDVPKQKLEKDGLFIKTDGKSLIIGGGTDKGILYAVYTFLEKYLVVASIHRK